MVHKCAFCTRTFLTPESYTRHLNRAHSEYKETAEQHICDTCDKGFSTSSSLKRHQKSHDPDAKYKFKCPHKDCKWKGSDNHADFQAHMSTHSGKKPFECDKCDKSFTSKQSLEGHSLSHTKHEKIPCPFAPECTHTFNSVKYLHEHLQGEHEGRLVYCSVCQKGFKNRALLKIHVDEEEHK